MSKDSIESLFEDAVNASENPNEGKEAAKFITSAPTPQPNENEAKARQEREAEERQRAIKLAESKRLAESERLASEERAKAEAISRIEQQKREQIEKDRIKREELKAREQEIANRKKEEQLKAEREAEVEAQRLEQKERELMESRALKEQQAEELRAEEQQRASRLTGGAFAVENVSRVLIVSDSYRGYDMNSQQAVKSFFNEEDESTIISLILNESNQTRVALHSLIVAQKAEQVDRAFLLVSLDVNLLTNMGKIMTNYTGAELPVGSLPGNRIEYCRALEKSISTMSPDQQANLEAIQRLLAIPAQ